VSDDRAVIVGEVRIDDAAGALIEHRVLGQRVPMHRPPPRSWLPTMLAFIRQPMISSSFGAFCKQTRSTIHSKWKASLNFNAFDAIRRRTELEDARHRCIFFWITWKNCSGS
jgi:hypothetical protein